jgi:polyhydroxyalkanoate synthesis regulator phasin
MDNILTPEEVIKPVTYGDLTLILGETIKNLSQESIKYSDILQENTFKLVDQVTNHIVKIRDDADYKRQRDVRFMIGLISQFYHCDKEIIYKEYIRWCEEFDKLNKPKVDSEGSNG